MNNSQFRKLVLDRPSQQSASSTPADKTAKVGRHEATPTLGSRARSSVPMTPRSVGGYNPSKDFARQLAERNTGSNPSQKKFRATTAPKGATLPNGYVDRAKQRTGDEEVPGSEKAQRVKALEEMMKLGQIDDSTFSKLRDEILGDDFSGERAGLVKGLDWGLLKKVKRGEIATSDLLDGGNSNRRQEGDTQSEEESLDVDDEFEKLEGQKVASVAKERIQKKGEMAPPALTGKKRNRDQVLAEMKAARRAAKEAAQPSLGSRFKKVGERRVESKIEKDKKGREVLVTIDEHGNVKKMVRKIQAKPVEEGDGLLMLDKDAKPLGMEVPESSKPIKELDEDINIFDDAGDDYDPLAGLDEDSSEPDTGEPDVLIRNKQSSGSEEQLARGDVAPVIDKKALTRNYFGAPKAETPSETTASVAFSDPNILAAFKKASALNPVGRNADDEDAAAKEAKRKKMLQQDDRDAQDMDMGFGSSRFGDDEELESEKVKLSEWGNDDGEGRRGEGKGQRKRGPKKRKGDGNNAADVMRAVEQRKRNL